MNSTNDRAIDWTNEPIAHVDPTCEVPDAFSAVTDEFLAGDRHGSRYAGKLLHGPEGRLVFMAFSQYPDGPDTEFPRRAV